MATLDKEFDKQEKSFRLYMIDDSEPVYDLEKIKTFMKSYILSLMEEVKLKRRSINEENLIDHSFEMGYHQALTDIEAKTKEALSKRGIV